MFTVIRELVSHLIGKGFGEVELVLGWPLAFAFWCLQYSITTWRVRRRESILLILAAVGIIALLMMPDWDLGALTRIVLAGCLFYLPLYCIGWAHRRRRLRQRWEEAMRAR